MIDLKNPYSEFGIPRYPAAPQFSQSTSYASPVVPSTGYPTATMQVLPQPVTLTSVVRPAPLIQTAPSVVRPLAPSINISQMQPTGDNWGQLWQSQSGNYQWEMQRMRQELEWAYAQLAAFKTQGGGDWQLRQENAALKTNLQRATEALTQLREAETQWNSIRQQCGSVADPNNLINENINLKQELNAAAEQNVSLNQVLQYRHKQAWAAWQKLRNAEEKWQTILKENDQQKRIVGDLQWERNKTLDDFEYERTHSHAVITELKARLHAAESEVDRLREIEADLRACSEDLHYHRRMLKSADEEIARLTGVDAELEAVTGEVMYLRKQVERLKEVEVRYAELCKEYDITRKELSEQCEIMRKQLHVQESSIDEYAEQTRTYFQTANQENIALRQQLKGIDVAEAEIARLRKELVTAQGYYDELQYSSKQLADAKAQIEMLERDLEKATSDLIFVKGQLVQQSEKARIASEELNRFAEDKTTSVLSDQLVESEREIIRLRNIIGETRLELDRFRTACRDQHEELNKLKKTYDELRKKRDSDLKSLKTTTPTTPTRVISSKPVTRPLSLPPPPPTVYYNEPVYYSTPTPITAPSVFMAPPVPLYTPQFSSTLLTTDANPPPAAIAVTSLAKRPKYAYFGVEVADGAVLAKQYGESVPIPAVRVINVAGPCAAAGLQQGDLISSINGQQVASLDDFNAIVSKIAPKETVKLVFERNGTLLGTDVITEETLQVPGVPGTLLSEPTAPVRGGNQ